MVVRFWVGLFAIGCGSVEADKVLCGDGTRLSGSECVPAYGAGGGTDSAEPTDSGSASIDADGDGFTPAAGDCNDLNPSVHPDAVEVCDGADNDCDGRIDDDDDSLDGTTLLSWYPDADADGFGADTAPVTQCSQPEGHVEADARGFDCNDGDAAFYPGAREDDCADANDYN